MLMASRLARLSNRERDGVEMSQKRIAILFGILMLIALVVIIQDDEKIPAGKYTAEFIYQDIWTLNVIATTGDVFQVGNGATSVRTKLRDRKGFTIKILNGNYLICTDYMPLNCNSVTGYIEGEKK